MPSETHTFITGPLWLKLKEDILGLRVLSQADFFAAASFHIRRLMLTRAGWSCHALCPTGRFVPELILFHRDEFQALLRFEVALRPGSAVRFPASRLGELLTSLRHRLADWEAKRTGAAYLFGLFDSDETWFYPDEAMWEKQSCFWVPTNCYEFPSYSDWRSHFDKLARSPFFKL